VYGGGTGRGHATRFVLATPSPTLPRKRERERTEIAARSGESWHLRPLIPAEAGIQSFHSNPHSGSPRSRGRTADCAGTNGWNFFDYISTTAIDYVKCLC